MNALAKIHRVQTVTPAQIDQLSDVLIDCVEGGASISLRRECLPDACCFVAAPKLMHTTRVLRPMVR